MPRKAKKNRPELFTPATVVGQLFSETALRQMGALKRRDARLHAEADKQRERSDAKKTITIGDLPDFQALVAQFAQGES